jgi:hypothetical protein
MHLTARIADAHHIAASEAALAQVGGVHREQRFVVEIEQAGDGAGATHAVPLVAQAAGEQADRARLVGAFGGRQVLDGDEAGAAGGGRENAVGVQALAAAARPFGERPLLRPLRRAAHSSGR